MVPLPIPASRATSSIVVFLYPKRASSRSMASRISSASSVWAGIACMIGPVMTNDRNRIMVIVYAGQANGQEAHDLDKKPPPSPARTFRRLLLDLAGPAPTMAASARVIMAMIFPGMDPYLEDAVLWTGVHASLVVYIRNYLQPLL